MAVVGLFPNELPLAIDLGVFSTTVLVGQRAVDTVSKGITVSLLMAGAELFTPSVPSDWLIPPPATKSAALDELAAKLSAFILDLDNIITTLGFIKLADIPQDLSTYNNDVPFAEMDDIPEDLSELNNDVGFITLSEIPQNLALYDNSTSQFISGDTNTNTPGNINLADYDNTVSQFISGDTTTNTPGNINLADYDNSTTMWITLADIPDLPNDINLSSYNNDVPFLT